MTEVLISHVLILRTRSHVGPPRKVTLFETKKVVDRTLRTNSFTMALGEKALKRRQQAADAKAGIVRDSIALRKMASAKPEVSCSVCKQIFLLTKSNADARRHHASKHDKVTWAECFPEIVKVEADLAAEAEKAKEKPAPAPAKKASKKQQAADLDDLLSAGIKPKKKGRNGKS